jgi:hypothetical protein
MSEEISMKDIINTLNTQSAELEELKRTYQETADYPVSTQIEYTDVLKEKAFEKAPFFRFLESKGQVLDNKAAYAGYFNVTESNMGASFIDELEDVPGATDESISELTEKMKTIVAPIEVSDLARLGNTKFDVLRRQIDRKFLDVLNLTDQTMTKGLGTAASKDFKGIEKIITSHKEDLTGEKLSESVIDDMLKVIYNDNGYTDALLVSPNVAKGLKALVAPYRRFNDTVDIGLGHRVFTYESLLGTQIPVIVTPNFSNEGSMAFIDSSTFELRRLLPPTLLNGLPTQKLATRNAIACFQTMINIGEHCNGLITGIEDFETKYFDGPEGEGD